MALVVSMRQGDYFYVDNAQVVVTNVRHQDNFDLATENNLFTINPYTWTEFLPGARAMASEHQPTERRLVRILIDAPGLKVGRAKPKEKSNDD